MSNQDQSANSSSCSNTHQHQSQPNLLVSTFVSECNSRGIAAPPSLINTLSSTSHTGVLDITDVMLGENSVEALCSALAACHRTTSFGARNAALAAASSSEEEESLRVVLQQPLTRVAIRNGYMGDKGLAILLRYLVKYETQSLEALEIPGNSIGSESVGDLATAVAVFRDLRTLVLDWNKCGGASGGATTMSTTSSSSFAAGGGAAASTAFMSRAASASPASAMSENVDLASVAAGSAASATARHHPSDSLHRLFKAVATHAALEHFSIQNNLLGKGCVEDICTILSSPSSALKHIDISWNGLGESSGARIANAISRAAANRGNNNNNSATESAAVVSSSSLKNNTNKKMMMINNQSPLIHFAFEGNSFSRRDAEQIDKTLSISRAQHQRDSELRQRLEDLQLAALQAQNVTAESRAKLAAQDMLHRAAQEEAGKAKKERDEMQRFMKEAQEMLHQERVQFQQRVQAIEAEATKAVEQASRRLRDALAEADSTATQCRIQRNEMEVELSAARDSKFAAEKEAASASASAQAARIAMEKIQAEHSAVARNLTESRNRIAELEMQVKIRDDELERIRSASNAHGADVEGLKAQLRSAGEGNERLTLQVRALEQKAADGDKRRADDLRDAISRHETELADQVRTIQRTLNAAQDEKAAAERMILDLKSQMEQTRRSFEQSAAEASSHSDKCRAQVTDVQLELEKCLSKVSLLEVEASRSESRAKSSEERSRVLTNEMQSSMGAHKDRVEELAREFERQLGQKEAECLQRAAENRHLVEEITLLKAKNEAMGIKMRQSQADLEKRVVKSLRSAMVEVQHAGAGSAAEE